MNCLDLEKRKIYINKNTILPSISNVQVDAEKIHIHYIILQNIMK